ncbi:Pol polyprotein [Plakobranchus ocellatus]|uniref:Pol polyprotein n=1 Tax=Plakobranchus ocellatus TaxID=259542 RepID=A0AAV4BYL4_9GAST|nr:Pol polyprotein [Plakobranchus ocellatus]
MKSFPATDKRITEIKEDQDKDKILSQVKEFCKTSWPAQAKKDEQLKRYWTVRHELAINQGILMYGNRLVIPPTLREDILRRIHEGHQGVVKCRAFARTTVWWPNLSTEIETMIRNCMTCEKTRTVPKQPLKPTPTPSYPWQRLGADLFEWKGRTYLLMVDYFSRWIEIALLNKTTTSSVIEHMKSIFAKFGIPEILISDNGPQFASREFAQFTEVYGILHKTSSPLHPESNGEAERAVRTIKNLLRKASDPYIALLNYRATPLQHGKSPAELLMGRQLPTKVPVPSDCYKPNWPYLKHFQKSDKQIKLSQKKNYDKRHRAKPLSQLHPGEKVWITTPKHQEAVTTRPVDQLNNRSYIIGTQWGQQRRNRFHLRKRDVTSRPEGSSAALPSATSTLPRSLRPPTMMTSQGATEEGITDTLVTSPMSVAASQAQPSISPKHDCMTNMTKKLSHTQWPRNKTSTYL